MNPNEYTFEVNAQQFAAAYCAASVTVSKDKSRPVSCAVHVERTETGFVLASTDTAALTECTIDVPASDRGNLPPVGWKILVEHDATIARDLKAAAKPCHHTVAMTVSGDDRRVTFDLPGRVITATLDYADFPNYRGLFRSDGATPDAAGTRFNPRYLASIDKVAQAAAAFERDVPQVAVTSMLDEMKPWTFRGDAVGNTGVAWRFLLMPCRKV